MTRLWGVLALATTLSFTSPIFAAGNCGRDLQNFDVCQAGSDVAADRSRPDREAGPSDIGAGDGAADGDNGGVDTPGGGVDTPGGGVDTPSGDT